MGKTLSRKQDRSLSRVPSPPAIVGGSRAREQWHGRLDFLLSCLGCVVGLGNLWRFPTLAYDNGGGIFFIPYGVMLVCVGVPVFLLELAIGQFSSAGPLSCWDFCPLIQGTGYAMMFVSALTASYYNVIMAWSLYFLLHSLQSRLPWATCGAWSTRRCSERIVHLSKHECRAQNGLACHVDVTCGTGTACSSGPGVCQLPRKTDSIVLWNTSLAREHGCHINFPATEYFTRQVTGAAFGDLSAPGHVRWEMVLYLLIMWLLVAACLSRGVKSSGKVVYFTVAAQYVLMFVLFIQGLGLQGSSKGLLYYLKPNFEHLYRAAVWKEATNQVFFSLSTSCGGLITLASYNKFHNDLFSDTLVVCIIDFLTSVFAGFVIFSFLGFLAHDQGIGVDQVATGGPALVFGVYPFSLSRIPGSVAVSACFFLMLILLGIDSQFTMVETVITCVLDRWPTLRRRKLLTVLGCCLLLFLTGIPMTTNGGVQILTIEDRYAGGWNVILIGLCECVAVGWCYGTTRFIQDIEVMAGIRFKPMCRCWWGFSWKFLTPALLTVTLMSSLLDYHRISSFPWWADVIGWSLTSVCILCLLAGAAFSLTHASGSLLKRFREASQPTAHWGPSIIEHRILVSQYVPGYVIDPLADPTHRSSLLTTSISAGLGTDLETPTSVTVSETTFEDIERTEYVDDLEDIEQMKDLE